MQYFYSYKNNLYLYFFLGYINRWPHYLILIMCKIQKYAFDSFQCISDGQIAEKPILGILVRHKGILYKAVITDFPKKIENSYVVKGW